MDLIIKGMAMPKSCFECRFYQSDMDYCEATGTDYPFLEEVKLKDCPLVEVPAHHGRLIDADKAAITILMMSNHPCGHAIENINDVVDLLKIKDNNIAFPAIIEAEE